MLDVSGLTAGYGDLVVLREVSMKIPRGKITVLIGANGAGKSTLIRTLSGQIRPMSGCITLKGERLDGLPSYKIARFGVIQVPEGRRIFPHMTVMDNLLLGGLPSEDKAQRKQQLEKVLEMFPILRKRSEQIGGTLSGGEQQMLAIARALMGQPTVLMLDEPTLGLSPLIVNEVMATIKELRESGITVLLVEQNVRRSLGICDYAYLLENGRIVLEGKPDALKANPEVQAAYMGL